jgi:glycerophosphoryl diester phosphodiesterase
MGISSLFSALRTYWRPIFMIHLVFTLLGAAVITLLLGIVLQGALSLSGSVAVVDQDIARLLLSPLGMVGAVLMVALLLAIFALELGALQVIAQASLLERPVSAMIAVRFALAHALPLFRMTLGLTLRVLAYILPYLGIVALVAWSQLTDHDINYYLAEKPSEFLIVVAVAATLAIPLLWLLARRLLDWCLVLPLVMFENGGAGQVFAASKSRVEGKRRMCLKALLNWVLIAITLSLVPLVIVELGMQVVLGSSSSQLTMLALLVGLLGAVWASLNFLVAALNLAGFTFVIAELYQRLPGEPSDQQVMTALTSGTSPGVDSSPVPLAVAALVVVVVATGALYMVLRGVKLDDQVTVIAHRGAAGSAPENTLASIEQAIVDGADWVEIDVQETRDGHVIVVHDSDFMKLAGNPTKVWEGDFEHIRQIDVGSWFDPKFSDQRVPTLLQVLEAVKRGGSKLVIELKYYGHDQQLEQRVIDLVEGAGMSDAVMVMSLKLEGVQKLKQLRPQWTGGLLAATKIGDITRLDTDFLAVNQNMADTAFIRRAHKSGKQVFVWTVNDALSLSHWISMGVDGVITDEPALAKDILAQRAKLNPAERLLLSTALFFGKPEALKQYRDNSP